MRPAKRGGATTVSNGIGQGCRRCKGHNLRKVRYGKRSHQREATAQDSLPQISTFMWNMFMWNSAGCELSKHIVWPAY